MQRSVCWKTITTLNRLSHSSIPLARSSSHLASAKLNVPIDFSATPLLHHTSSSALSNPELPSSIRDSSKTTRQSLHESINTALRHALSTDDSVLLFGEDIAFGGVFRCSAGLQSDFGTARVFNTPLTEQGIVGFAIGAASEGTRPVAEIQFADYVYPAFDQLVNEAAKMRYREGKTGMSCGGLVVRMPCGGVGHGALYVL
jgi:2-oxoisovalerate dehydrogenase E1 component beta subunit